MSKKQNNLAILMATLACLSGTGFAQSLPNIGDALRQAQPPTARVKPEADLPPIGGVQNAEAPMVRLPQGLKVEVKRLQVVGNRVIDTSALDSLLADALGQTLSLSELEALAQRITKYYRVHGYFVARAYVPAQEVNDGVIKIRVLEGNYGNFHLNNRSLVHDDIVQGMLDAVKGQDIVSLDTLERAMLIINDTPGAQVLRADVMPGNGVGTSDFAVDTMATAPYDGFVMLDNYGSVYTGKSRLSFNADANSLTGRGDKLSLSGMSTDGMGLQNIRLAYGVPLSSTGMRGELAVSKTTYQLGDSYQSLHANGTAQALDLGLTYPVRRIQAQTIEASLNMSYKSLQDRVDSTNTNTPKSSSSITAGLHVRDDSVLWGMDGQTTAGIAVMAGDLEINDGAAAALDAAGANTHGGYAKLNLTFSRQSLLPADFRLGSSVAAQQSLNGNNLDGSERMAVSGPGAVAAYPSGELIGTNAILVAFELSHSLPAMAECQHALSLFANWGQVNEARPLAGQSGREISSVGIAWNASYKAAYLKAQLAHRLESTPAISEPTGVDNFLMQLGMTF